MKAGMDRDALVRRAMAAALKHTMDVAESEQSRSAFHAWLHNLDGETESASERITRKAVESITEAAWERITPDKEGVAELELTDELARRFMEWLVLATGTQD